MRISDTIIGYIGASLQLLLDELRPNVDISAMSGHVNIIVEPLDIGHLKAILEQRKEPKTLMEECRGKIPGVVQLNLIEIRPNELVNDPLYMRALQLQQSTVNDPTIPTLQVTMTHNYGTFGTSSPVPLFHEYRTLLEMCFISPFLAGSPRNAGTIALPFNIDYLMSCVIFFLIPLYSLEWQSDKCRNPRR